MTTTTGAADGSRLQRTRTFMGHSKELRRRLDREAPRRRQQAPAVDQSR